MVFGIIKKGGKWLGRVVLSLAVGMVIAKVKGFAFGKAKQILKKRRSAR